MTEPTGQQPGQQPEGQQPTPNLSESLRELGEQMEQAMKAFANNENTHRMQQEFMKGMTDMNANLQKAVETFKTNPQVQNLTDRGQQAIDDAQENPVFREMQNNMARAISQMSEHLATFAERMRASQAGAGDKGTSQQVPIDDESDNASTGPTTRL